MFKYRTGTFTKMSFGQSLLKSQVGTIVKFRCRVFDRHPNCNIQETLRCKFFEKISGLIISLIQIPDYFLHPFLKSVNSSMESYGVSDYTWVNFLTTTYWGYPKQTRFNLGLSSTSGKNTNTKLRQTLMWPFLFT